MFGATKEKKVALTVEEVKALPLIMSMPPRSVHCDKKSHYIVNEDSDTYWNSGVCTCLK
jgi:hypothetical protein